MAVRPYLAKGLSLVEMLSSLLITGMIVVAAIVVYQRIQATTSSILQRIQSIEGPSQVIDLIADDLARLDGLPGCQVQIDNKIERGLPSARLIIRRTIADDRNQEQPIEQITWQSAYDLSTGRLTLYRARQSIFPEDRLLDLHRSDVEKLYPFVPVCSGLSAFTVKAPQGPNILDRWASSILPNAVIVSVSFAEPVKNARGLLEIPQEGLITRTITIDRLRSIKLEIPQLEPNTPKTPEQGQPAAGRPQPTKAERPTPIRPPVRPNVPIRR